MEVYTCRQNTACLCTNNEVARNRREINGTGELETHKRTACPHFWRGCPFCYSINTDGVYVCLKSEN